MHLIYILCVSLSRFNSNMNCTFPLSTYPVFPFKSHKMYNTWNLCYKLCMQIIWYTFSKFIITKNDVKNKLKYYFYSKIEFGIGG